VQMCVYILDQHQQPSRYSHVRLSVCMSVPFEFLDLRESLKSRWHKKGTDKRTWLYRCWCWPRYIHFMGSATHPSACYGHLHKLNRPFCTVFKYKV